MTFRELLRVSRPRFWIYLLGPYLVGLAAARQWPDAGTWWLGVYLTLPANLLIYGVNDIFDRDTDRTNVKKSGYENRLRAASVPALWRAILLCNLPFLPILIATLPAASLLWLLLFLATGIGYSAPPVRAKARPVLDAAFNILYAAPGFAAYVAASGSTPAWQLVVAALSWCMAMHAYSAIPDIRADRSAGLATVATRLGAGNTLVFCAAGYMAATVLSFAWLGWYALAAGLAYLVLMGVSAGIVRRGSGLLGLYGWFPFVNTIIGAGLFLVVLIR